MEGKMFGFSFGGAFGDCSETTENLSARYNEKCLEAASWLNDTPYSCSGHGWMGLPDADLTEIKEIGEWLKSFDSIVHIGIGGSSLGNLMLNQTLLGDYINDRNSGGIKFYMADNPDPVTARKILKCVEGTRVALVCISKSGQTAETMSQFIWFRKNLPQSESQENLLLITDPKEGLLRAYASEQKCRVLDLLPSVGGRYSVLSAVGLAEAYALGIDIDELIRGAALMRERLIKITGVENNPAWLMSALLLFHAEQGRNMNVVMPYTGKLSYFVDWFAQLWSESIGKDGKGTTPIRAIGPKDQHSQMQLYLQGPNDKFYTVISVHNHYSAVLVPQIKAGALKQLDYLSGKDIGEMMNIEAKCAVSSLIKNKRPVVWIEVESLSEKALGAMIFFCEYLTAITGRIMGINPFDQPGVEQGKRYTYGIMGRAGYEQDASEATKQLAIAFEKRIEL